MCRNIGFVYDSKIEYLKKYKTYKKSFLNELVAEFDTDETISEIVDALISNGYKVDKVGNVSNLLKSIAKGKNWDIVFNIAEGLYGRNRESQVPLLLELYNIPYTGSDALTMGLTMDKVLAKKVVAYHNILTPKFVCIENLFELKLFCDKIRSIKFPLFTKLRYEGSSKGLSEKSLVKNFSELKRQVSFLLKKYKQPVIIEKFIFGKEFTVVVMGNKGSKKFPIKALPPVQIVINNKKFLGEEYYTFARVYNNETSYICPVEEKKSFVKRLQTTAEKIYEILEVKDFGRIDFRVDTNDEIYFLECNPLPHLGKIDLFPLVAQAMGLTYEKLISRIVEIAFDRYKFLEKKIFYK
ncbi:MAG: hypothetical protein SNJ64_00575 [Endomicrobiia bacterium]